MYLRVVTPCNILFSNVCRNNLIHTYPGYTQLDLNAVYDALDERGERELELSQVLTKRYAGIEAGLQRGGAVFRFPAAAAPQAAAGRAENGTAAAAATASGQVTS